MPTRISDVPIVDFTPAARGDRGGLERVAAAAASACEDIGFFYLANHPVPRELRSRVFEAAAAFFSLPEKAKRRLSMERTTGFRGYIPFDARLYAENRRGAGGAGFQLHLGDAQLDAQPPDSAESFQIHAELPETDPDVLAGKPLHGPNVWPDELPGLRDTLLEYYGAMTSLARHLLDVFAVGLALEPGYFERYYRKPLMQLRLMHYPPHPEDLPRVPFGVRPHCDAGAFSLLLQDEVGGLEIRNKRGEWTFVQPIEDTFVVNIGDTMKLWTNNRFQSTWHRVVNTYGASRFSVPFFANPDYDAVIEPLPTCVDDEHPPVFDTLHCGESMLHTYSRIWPSAPPARDA